MKIRFPLALCAALLAAPLHAQTTQKEIQADLLVNQIVAAMQAKDYTAADDLFKQYDQLGVVMPPPLLLQRAVLSLRRENYVWGEIFLRLYLKRAERGSDGYRQAIKVLAEIAPKAAAEKERKCTGTGGDSLHEAVEKGNCLTVKRLIQQGAPVNVKDKHGYTPLMEAARQNALEIAALLIAHGADVNVKRSIYTPLVKAAEGNALEIAALLIAHGADVNVKSGIYTPLIEAARQNALEIAALLIAHGADVNAKSGWGWGPLHYASLYNALETVALLIEHGADVNAKNDSGETPLDRAEDSPPIAALLRRHGGVRGKN